MIPERNLRIVTYPQIMGDLQGTMESLLPFLELDPEPGFAVRVQEQDAVQKARQSPHGYSLEKFGLSRERIRKDLDFMYEAYRL